MSHARRTRQETVLVEMHDNELMSCAANKRTAVVTGQRTGRQLKSTENLLPVSDVIQRQYHVIRAGWTTLFVLCHSFGAKFEREQVKSPKIRRITKSTTTTLGVGASVNIRFSNGFRENVRRSFRQPTDTVNRPLVTLLGHFFPCSPLDGPISEYY